MWSDCRCLNLIGVRRWIDEEQGRQDVAQERRRKRGSMTMMMTMD
jgi:hypothetical protein